MIQATYLILLCWFSGNETIVLYIIPLGFQVLSRV